MEVILKSDVKNLGFANDVVKVKNGYGLNYLIPQGYAIIASETNKKVHAETVKQRAHKIAKLRNDAQAILDAIGAITLTIPMKAGEKGKLFGSVTSQHLADILKKLGYSIDRKQISMPAEHVKTLGSYTAELVLHRDVKGPINFDVIEQE
ncbi:MAG: 50S ribosomal protein L9 [Bacteroidetes bacterium]|nr:50S ribosomal protein L9 [Bacteroidota bacterium]